MSDLKTQNVHEHFNRLTFGKVSKKLILSPLGLTFNGVTQAWTPQGIHKGGQSSTAKTEDAIEYLQRMVEPRCLETDPNCEHNNLCWLVPLIWGTDKEFKENKNLKFGILDAYRLDQGGGNPNTPCLLVEGKTMSLNEVGQEYVSITHRAATDIFKVGVIECGVAKYLKILTMIQDERFRSFSGKIWKKHYPRKPKTLREKKSGEVNTCSKKRPANEDPQPIVKNEPRSPKRRKIDDTDPQVDEIDPQANKVDPQALTFPQGHFTEDGAFKSDALRIDEINKVSRYFANYGSLQAHDFIEEVAGTQVPSDDEDLGTIEGLKCQDCEVQFWRPYDLLAHQEGVHSQIGSYVCMICDAKFSKIYVLTEHIMNFVNFLKLMTKIRILLSKLRWLKKKSTTTPKFLSFLIKR